MVPRPLTLSTVLFRIVAITLIAINVTWHGTVALFIGGPFGLGVFLLAVVGVWIWSWTTLRRWHTDAEERPDAVPPGER